MSGALLDGFHGMSCGLCIMSYGVDANFMASKVYSVGPPVLSHVLWYVPEDHETYLRCL